MKFYGDYHLHTTYSDGNQDIEAVVKEAKQKGLEEVAITDHGPSVLVIGVKNEDIYYQIKDEIDEINLSQNEVKVYWGAEGNIRGLDGELDIPPALVQEMDIVIAGLHPYTCPSSAGDGYHLFVRNSLRHLGKGFKEKAVNNNTKACVAAVYNNPGLDILSHPGLFFDIDYEEVARACSKKGVFFEINCGHKHPALSDIIKVSKAGALFIINSDAHFSETVGDLGYGIYAVQKAGIDPDKVVNREDGGGFLCWKKEKKKYT